MNVLDFVGDWILLFAWLPKSRGNCKSEGARKLVLWDQLLMANQLKLGTCYCVSHRLRVVWDMSPSQNYARGVVVHVDLPNTKRAHSTQHTAHSYWPLAHCFQIIWTDNLVGCYPSVRIFCHSYDI